MVMMEGILWKWTNYLSGWQPRWFILDYGVLAYYRSQEDVHLGSRGSVKMSSCEILINNNDPVRIDLKIPPENFMYLKASTSQERQKWLVALGTSKACLVDSNYEEQQIQMNSMSYVREKMKELMFCRGIMIDQVHLIKSQSVNSSHENESIKEASALLSVTCDTFVTNLQDIMEIIEDNINSFSSSPVSTPKRIKHNITKKSPSSSSPSTPSSFSTDSTKSSAKSSIRSSSSAFSYDKDSLSKLKPELHLHENNEQVLSPSESISSYNDAYKNRNLPLKDMVNRHQVNDSSVSSASSIRSSLSDVSSPHPSTISPQTHFENQNKQQHNNIKNENHITSSPEKISNKVIKKTNIKENMNEKQVTRKSVFGIAKVRFEDVHINDAGLIPTQTFLNACASILPVFDSLGSTTFAPVKMDIQGNIKKIQVKYDTDVVAFEYLQNIVSQEIKSNITNARNSSTDALLWLKRALEFISVFLSEVTRGNKDLVSAADIAYSKSLKKYHGWMVRGVFALAVKACPYFNDFIKALSNQNAATIEETLAEMTSSVEALRKILSKLNNYYRKNKLDSDTVI